VKDQAITGGRRLLQLDGWRGVSILTVYLGHFLPVAFISNGRMGVELFFVLSGRLMAEILFIEKSQLGLFYRRRIARVWPAMLIFVVSMRLIFTHADRLLVRWVDVASALSLTLNYACLYFHRIPVIEPVWSLCIEEWAYLLLGLLAFVTRRLAINALPVIAIVAAGCALNGILQTLAGGDYYAVYWRTDTRIASILMASAVYLVIRQRRIEVPSWLPLVAGLTGIAFSLTVVPDYLRYSLGTLAFAIAVATIEAVPAWFTALLTWRPLCQIGLWSFSLYLWQQPFYQFEHQAPRWLLVAGAVILGLCSFYIIEQPLRRALNSLQPQRLLRPFGSSVGIRSPGV